MQALTPPEAEALVELDGGGIGDLGLERDLVCVARDHGVDREPDEARCDPVVPVRFVHGQHGDVAA